jgi:hypothetical protein
MAGRLSRDARHHRAHSLTDMGTLLDRVRAAGLPVRCTVHGDSGGLSEGRQLTVYRIVQEAQAVIFGYDTHLVRPG